MTAGSETTSRSILRLQPSVRRSLLFALLCLAFAAIGIWMIVSKGTWMAWATTAFFGVGTLVLGSTLLPGSSYLELRGDAFTVCSLWRAQSFQWRDVGPFKVGYLGPKRAVLFDMAPEYHERTAARKAARMLAGSEGALPDTFGKSADDLARLMNEWRDRTSGDAPPTSS